MSNINMLPEYDTKLFTDVYDEVGTITTENTYLYDYTHCGIPTTISQASATTLFYLLYAKYGNNPIANYDETQWKYKLFSLIYMYGPSWEKRLDIQRTLREMSEAEIMQGFKNSISNTRTGQSSNTKTGTNSSTTTVDQDTTGITVQTDAKTGNNVNNHAFNPGNTGVGTGSTTELTYIDQQTAVHSTDNLTSDISNAGTNDSTTTVSGNVNDTVTGTDSATETASHEHTIAKLEAYAQLWELINNDVTNEFLAKFITLFKKFVRPAQTYIYETEEEA